MPDNRINIDMQFDELLSIGVGADPSFVGLQVSTLHSQKPTFGFTIPSHRLPDFVARLTTACARTAQLEAQARGADAEAVLIAEARTAFKATAAGITIAPSGPESIVAFVADKDMAVLPIELTRAAAQALFSALADRLAS